MAFGVVPGQGTGSYAVDIVFCIDVTGSMGNVIDEVKDMATGFRAKVQEALEESSRQVDVLRTKVVSFRDFSVDKDALVSSPFYTLPEEEAGFQEFVNGLEASGGGDEPENGLEALAEAMNTDWTQDGNKRRHIIVMFTDASAINFEDSNKGHAQYPANAPASLAALQDWWEGGTPNGSLQGQAERLILFTPDAEPWNTIRTWNKTEYSDPVTPGGGCAEASMDAILALIVKSFAVVQ